MKSLIIRLATLALTLSTGIAAVALWRHTNSAGVAAVALQGNTKATSSAQPANQIRQNEIEEEEYAVYSALINNSAKDENVNSLFIIMDRPFAWVGMMDEGPDSFYEDIMKSSPDLMAETVYDLKAKNKEQHRFTRRFNIKGRYILVSEKDIADLFSKDVLHSWEKFYRKYPKSGGYTTFSRVGFNAEKTQALVYQAHSCGGLCGQGSYMLLTKTNGVWTIKNSVGPGWIS